MTPKQSKSPSPRQTFHSALVCTLFCQNVLYFCKESLWFQKVIFFFLLINCFNRCMAVKYFHFLCDIFFKNELSVKNEGGLSTTEDVKVLNSRNKFWKPPEKKCVCFFFCFVFVCEPLTEAEGGRTRIPGCLTAWLARWESRAITAGLPCYLRVFVTACRPVFWVGRGWPSTAAKETDEGGCLPILVVEGQNVWWETKSGITWNVNE